MIGFKARELGRFALEICPHAAAATSRSVHHHHNCAALQCPNISVFNAHCATTTSMSTTLQCNSTTLQNVPPPTPLQQPFITSMSCMQTTVALCTFRCNRQQAAVPVHPIDQRAAPKANVAFLLEGLYPPPLRCAVAKAKDFKQLCSVRNASECSYAVSGENDCRVSLDYCTP